MNNATGSVRLDIALGTSLILQLKGLEDRYNSMLLGMEPDNFLLIRKPHPSQLKAPLTEGAPLIVRFVNRGTVWGFEATVIGNVHKPPRLVFISYPDRIEHLSLRKHHRVICRIPATIVHGKSEFKGLIGDISAGGSRFKAQLPKKAPAMQIQPDDSLRISLPLLGMEGVQTLEGVVRNVSQDSEEFTVGMQFVNVRPDIAARIEKYVYQIEEYDRSLS